MATIELRTANQQAATTNPTEAGNVTVPYALSILVDLAVAQTTKGSNLAAADVINLGTLPAGAVILGGVVNTILASDATTCTVNVGVAGGSTVASGTSVTATGMGTPLLSPVAVTATGTQVLTVTLATFTGTLTKGQFLVDVFIVDGSNRAPTPGLAQPKS